MYQEIIIQPEGTAEQQMQADILLLESLATNKRCVCNFYQWQAPSITHGYFIDPDNFLKKDSLAHYNFQIARRPTGGGLIFHHCDLAFSVLVPNTHPRFSVNTLENYAFINTAVEKSIALFRGQTSQISLLKENSCFNADEACNHFCMAKPTCYDVMLDGRKVGGGAQRRSKHGYLHQGTIAIALPKKDFLQEVIKDPSIGDAMRINSMPLIGENYSVCEYQEAKKEMQMLLWKTLKAQFE